MLGCKARVRRDAELRARAAWLIERHGVSGALALATERFYAAGSDRARQTEASALRSAIKSVAGVRSLDTATRYLEHHHKTHAGPRR